MRALFIEVNIARSHGSGHSRNVARNRACWYRGCSAFTEFVMDSLINGYGHPALKYGRCAVSLQASKLRFFVNSKEVKIWTHHLSSRRLIQTTPRSGHRAGQENLILNLIFYFPDRLIKCH